MVKDQKQKMRIIIFFKLTRQLKNKESNMFFCSKIEKSKNFENSHENTQKTSYKMSLSSCEDQRTDNSERRRKPMGKQILTVVPKLIREQITPKGDGNEVSSQYRINSVYQRTDNSERRRKHFGNFFIISQVFFKLENR